MYTLSWMVFTFCNIFANPSYPCTTERASHEHDVDSTTRPIHTNAISNDSPQRWVPLSVVFFAFLHQHDQNDDGFMHATCIDELQHESLIWTHEPMDDKQRTSGMSSNDVGRDRGWLGSIDWPLIGYYYSRIDYDVIDEIWRYVALYNNLFFV